MNISLDFDETFTRDPLFWMNFARDAMEAGHTVYCVTLRHPRQCDEIEFTLGTVIGTDRIIATAMEPKRQFCESLNIQIHVWIDDTPEMIGVTPWLGHPE